PRTTIIAAIITSPRHRLAILIVARFPSRLSRYTAASGDPEGAAAADGDDSDTNGTNDSAPAEAGSTS
ncbi:hypothetical protein, partial [Bradyrhizobium sp. 87]|uniref:hypothetical protein n=1 Tax=Bradyrhizobium sp. 87 TaxID=2782682 RepID=UPI001FF966D9